MSESRSCSGSANSAPDVDLGGPGGSEDAFEAAQAEAVGVSESSGGRSRQVGVDDGSKLRFAESVVEAPCLPGERPAPGSLIHRCVLDAKPQLRGLCRVRVSGKYLHCTSEAPFLDWK